MAPRYTTAMDGGNAVFAGAKNGRPSLGIYALCHSTIAPCIVLISDIPVTTMAPRYTVHPVHIRSLASLPPRYTAHPWV
jgi:hypothetical protein